MYPHSFLLFLTLLPCSIEAAIVQGSAKPHRALVRTDRSSRFAAAKSNSNGKVEVHQSPKNTADVIKNTWDGRIFATSGLVGILMLLVGLCFLCKPSAPVCVDMSMLDEKLVKEAAYLKRTEEFPKPWTSTFSGAVIYTAFLFAVGILLVALLSVGISHLALPCDACTHPGVIFVVISLMLYLWFIGYGIWRWRKYFKDLPQRQDSILNKRLPKNTLEPTPMSMRPLWMSCFQYLWCMHNIYVSFFFLAGYRLLTSQVNAEVIRDLNIKPSKSTGKTLGVFMLETTAFLWFKGAEEDENGKLIGHFSSSHLGPVRTVLKDKGLLDIVACEIWVDLKERTAVRASIDNVEIKLSRAFVIVLFLMIGSGHAWLHAICSWAVLPESPDTFIRRMSLCTMFFNHLGFDGGLPILALASGRKSEFLGSGNLRSNLFAEELPYGDENNMLGPYQAGVQDFFTPELAGKLVPYSRFCAWAYLLYEPFLALFDAEPLTISLSPLAYFYHTILHCTDHWELTQMFNANLEDWASVVVPSEDAQSSEFGADEPHIDYHAMGPVFLLSAGGLSEDFPKLYNVYFRDGPDHIPFYKKVYELGKYLDPELAYHLQACIIK